MTFYASSSFPSTSPWGMNMETRHPFASMENTHWRPGAPAEPLKSFRSAPRPDRLTLDDFKSDVAHACNNFYQRHRRSAAFQTRGRPHHYQQVSALLFSWDVDNFDPAGLRVGDRVSRLTGVLARVYNYDVTTMILRADDDDPQRTLEEAVRKHLADLDDHCLFIIYYAGCSTVVKDGKTAARDGDSTCRLSLQPSRSPQTAARSIDFTTISDGLLAPASAQVLGLLDCAADGITTRPGMEYITAEATDDPACLVDHIIEALQTSFDARTIMSAPQLYARIVEAVTSMPVYHHARPLGEMPVCLAPMVPHKRWVGELLTVRDAAAALVTFCVTLTWGDVTTWDHVDDWLASSAAVFGETKIGDRVQFVQVSPSPGMGAGMVLEFRATVDVWCGLRRCPAVQLLRVQRSTRTFMGMQCSSIPCREGPRS